MLKTENIQETIILYDKECPFCSEYVRLVELRKNIGKVTLVNARESSHPAVVEALKLNLDLNEGMVMFYKGRVYHGADCINMLAVLSSSNGFFNKLASFIFKSPKRAKILYPWLRAGRILVLKMLRKKKI